MAPIEATIGSCSTTDRSAGAWHWAFDNQASFDSQTWCTCPTDPGQLSLFATEGLQVELDWEWPTVETSFAGRPGFWFRRMLAVFGDRRGVGPLIICPDTNILIHLYENLDSVDVGVGLIAGPLIEDKWPTTVDAIRDLLGVWWWRDLRFWVDPALHMRDARKPIRPDRRRAREIAVDELSQDFFERGGFDCILPEGIRAADPVCQVHLDTAPAPPETPTPPDEPRWPTGELDRQLARGALSAGCHVFLTEDTDVLKCHPTLLARGMAVLRPADLLSALDAAGELEPVESPDGLLPDLSALSRFYSLRSPEEAHA